ncbi:hypothetical protein [Kribbella sp. HUAS MG21]|uniref:Uncharacterized protein n=1 Tax=Kribbella sp. HUAS MG21 TaxID=3160966 RepID=A0AAU7TBU2_9ACTN
MALYLLLPDGKASAFLGLQLAVFGICLGAAFAPNHKGMPIVREYCELHGIADAEVDLFTSYRIVVEHLNAVGLRARDPFDCPLAAELRSVGGRDLA